MGWYDVWTGDLPFSKFTLKVVECEDGSYHASPNVFFKSNDGIEYCCGMGKTVESSIRNAITAFYEEITKHKAIESACESEFVWLCWTPFGATAAIFENIVGATAPESPEEEQAAGDTAGPQ